MFARVEPPRARASHTEPSPEANRYPGLDPTERLAPLEPSQLAALEDEPPPPLWIAPIDVPPADRPVGFFAALPEELPEVPAVDREPPREPPEGLFDVPGLLERLWLARALEAGRELPAAARPARVPLLARAAFSTPPRSVAPQPARPAPEAPATEDGTSGGAEAAPAAPPAERGAASPELTPPRVPTTAVRSWICPYCYLTNDLGTTACAGCRRPAPVT